MTAFMWGKLQLPEILLYFFIKPLERVLELFYKRRYKSHISLTVKYLKNTLSFTGFVYILHNKLQWTQWFKSLDVEPQH